ncbi:MAG: N-acyl homoserine lactonase family protein [Pseudomonadales bacterium]|nr:N-acyl homoserine lactonase family protein [Pseudomonadales bacterium]
MAILKSSTARCRTFFNPKLNGHTTQRRQITISGSMILLLAILLNGCASTGDPKPEPLKLYVFDCGNIKVADVSLFSPGFDEGQEKELTNSCYLIRHPEGDMVWDTGLNDAIGPKGLELWDGAFHLSVTNPLGKQLKSLQIKPEEIDYLGISHFHMDHTGNANLFTNASLLIQKEEYDAAFGKKADKYGFQPETYSQVNREKINVLNSDHDVFGDGKVIIKRAIGHTPGHQALYIDLEDEGPIMLSGDLYHFTKNRTFRRVPSFNYDKAQTQQSMDSVEIFMRNKGAKMWIQHDKEQNESIRRAPYAYQ